MPSSEQENGGLLNAAPAPAGRGACAAPHSAAVAFRFSAPRALIDWRALHTIEVGRVVADTDIDALERVLDVVVSGDIEAEDARNLTPFNFIQLFRVAQLTVDYLLHVQDRLATDGCAAKSELARAQQQVQLLQLKVKELREEAAGSRKEARHLKKSLRTFEALALSSHAAPPVAPQPPAEVRVVERVVEVVDPSAARRVDKLECELEQLQQERQALQRQAHRDNSKLADALAAATTAAQASTAAAVESARHEERQAAEARLHAAVEEERKRHSKAKLSVVVTGEDSPSMHSKLVAAQRREREAERRAEAAEQELARAAAAAAKAAAAPTTELRRLRAQLEATQAEADMLRSQLEQRGRQQGTSPRRPGQGPAPPDGGLAVELEDDSNAHAQQLQAQVEAQRAELAAAEAAQARLAARCTQLEQQLQDLRQPWQPQQQSPRQQQASSRSANGQATAATAAVAEQAAVAQVLQQEVARLRQERAALKEECRRLKRQAAEDSAEIEHLTQRLRQLSGTRSQPTSQPASPAKPAAERQAAPPATGASSRQCSPCSSPARGLVKEPQQVEGQQPAAQGGIGSPIEEPADEVSSVAAGTAAPATSGARQDGHQPSSSGAALVQPRSPARHVACSPSEADKQQFRREMQHVLPTAERPGVVSRFKHSLGSFLALRADLEGELEAELAAELESYGLDPAAQQLTDSQLQRCMVELERRRAVAGQGMSATDRQRCDYMRSTADWHVQQMAEIASGQRVGSPVKGQQLARAPNLRPIRTASKDAELSPRRRGFVEQVLDQVGDEAAVYSPLARGASVLSELGYLHDGAGGGDCVTPRSTIQRSTTPRSVGSTVHLATSDGGATPRSPWALTHDRVRETALGIGGSSPLGQAASVRSSPLGQAASLRSSPLGPLAAGSAAASPTRQPRAARAVQFGDEPASPGQLGAHWGGGGGLVPAQRMGRRLAAQEPRSAVAAPGQGVSPTKRAASSGSTLARQPGTAPAPGSRRVYRQGEHGDIRAAAGCVDAGGRARLGDSRDLDTGDAAPVQPAARRVPRQWGGAAEAAAPRGHGLV